MAYKDKGEAGKRDVGIIIKNPAYQGILVKPVYGKQIREYTLFRPTGPLNKELTDFLPWRNSGAPGDIGVGGYFDWFFKEDVFDGGTANRVTFLAATMGPDGKVISNDTRPSIAHDFVRLVRRGVKDTVDELKLMRGSNSRSAPVKSPKTFGFVQGMLMARGADDFRAAPKFPCILMLPTSARTALYDALEAPNPAFNGDPADLANRFLSGDVLRAAGGKIIVLSSNKAEAVQAAPTSVSFSPGAASAAPTRQRQGGDGEEFNKYICEIRPQGFADLPRDQMGRIAIDPNLLFTPWNQALRYLTEQEMIEQLVRAYSDVPHILRLGLGHIPGALPPSIAAGTSYFPGTGGGPAPAAPAAPPPPAAPVASAAAPSFGAPAFAPVPAGAPDQDGDPDLSPATTQGPVAFAAPAVQPPAQPAAPGVSFGQPAAPAAAPGVPPPPAPGQAPLPPEVAAALEILKRNMGAGATLPPR